MATELAQAYVQIIPSAKGIKGSLTNLLSGEAESAGKESGGTLSSAIKTGLKAAGAGTLAASGAVVAFGKSAVEAGMQFDSSMSQVAATMGLTVDDIGELREYAQEMGASTAFSASQAADALNYMALAGYTADQSMEALPNVLNLAAAGGIELATASDMVTDAQSALGLTFEESAELVDKMAKASSKSNTSVAQLGEAILTVGGTAKNLKGGTTELSTALGILADNGVKGAEGGTALRNIILSLSAPTDKAATMMESLGLNAYDADGNLRPLNDTFSDLNGVLGTMNMQERTEVLNTLFNKVDLKSANALLANTGNSFTAVQKGLKNSGVQWDKYSNKVWAANGAIDGLYEEIAYNMSTLGTSAEDLQQYLEFEYELDPEDAKAAISSVSESLKGQESRWKELTREINEADDAAKDMANTQLDNLAGDVTLFQSALEGAQIAVSDGLTPTLREFVQFGSNSVSDLTKAFKEDGFGGAMEALGGILSDAIAMILEKLPAVADAGMQFLGALVKGVLENLPQLVTAAGDIVKTIIDKFNETDWIQTGKDVLGYIIEGVTTLGETAFSLIGSLASSIGQKIKETDWLQVGKDVLNFIVSGITGLGENVSMLIRSAGTTIGDALKDADWLQTGKDIIGFVISSMKTLGETNLNVLKEVGSAIGDALKAIDWKQLGNDILTLIGTGLSAVAELLGDLIPAAGTAIADLFKGTDWLQLGEDILGFIGNGLGTIGEGFKTIISTAATAIGDLLKKTDWLQVGKDILGFVITGLGTIAEGAIGLITAAGTAIGGFLKDVDWVEVGTSLLGMIITGLGTIGEGAIALITAAGTAVGGFFKDTDWLQVGLDILGIIIEGLGTIGEGAIALITAAGTSIGGFLKEADWVGIGTSLLGFIIDGLGTIGEGAKSLIESAGSAIGNVLVTTNWRQIGKDILTKIGVGLLTVGTTIGEWILTAGTSIVTWFGKTNWTQLGKDILSVIGKGLLKVGITIGETIKSAVESIKNWFLTLSIDWEQVGIDILTAIGKGLLKVGETIGGWIESAAGAIAAIFVGEKEEIETITEEGFNNLATETSASMNEEIGIVKSSLETQESNFSSHMRITNKSVEDGLGRMHQITTSGMEGISNTVSFEMGEASKSVTDEFGNINSEALSAFSIYDDTCVAGFGAFSTETTETMGDVKKTISDGFADVNTDTENAMEQMKKSAGTGGSGFNAVMHNNMQSLLTQHGYQLNVFKKNTVDKISETKSSAKGISWTDVGSGICNGIASGIDGGWSWLSSKVSGVASSLLSAAKRALGINSPSKLFRDEIGKNLMLGAAEGIEDNEGYFVDSAVRAGRNVTEAMRESTGAVQTDIAWRLSASNAQWRQAQSLGSQVNMGGLNINIYAPEGADTRSIAEEVREMLIREVQMAQGVFA